MTDEVIKDYGKWNLPEGWNELTLKQYSEIEKYYSDKEKTFNVADVLEILTNHTRDEIDQLPIEFTEKILDKLEWIKTSPEYGEPTNKLVINGETYQINFQNKLKTGEFIASETILKNDRFNYAALLAILCRKEGEIYDSKFENEVLEDRIALFEKLSMTEAMRMVNFFLQLWVTLEMPTQLSSQVEEEIDHIARFIKTSQKNGTLSKRSTKSAMKTLQKLKQSISST